MKKYITFNTLANLWRSCENDKDRETLRKFLDVFRIATKGKELDKVRVETYEKAKTLYQEFRKLNRQNDTLLVLDSNFEGWQSEYRKRLEKRNEKQEKKVKQLAQEMGFKIVYYSHIATLQNIKTRQDIHLARVY
jgi:hypothetical protein